MGEKIKERILTRKKYAQVKFALAEVLDLPDPDATQLLGELEDENPDGELSPILKTSAMVTELLFGPAAYRTVLYATTRRRSASTNLGSVYKALLTVYRGNHFPDAKAELPKLYQWAAGRAEKPKTRSKPKKSTPPRMLTHVLPTRIITL